MGLDRLFFSHRLPRQYLHVGGTGVDVYRVENHRSRKMEALPVLSFSDVDAPEFADWCAGLDREDSGVILNAGYFIYNIFSFQKLPLRQRSRDELILWRLKKRFPRAVGPPKDDICYATQNRQAAVRALAREADAVLVVGSQNSSNSRRLAELAAAEAVAARLIDGPEDIDLGWFSEDDTVVITAGASAPEDVVQQCVGLLCEHFPATVQTRTISQEQVRFALPKELR